MSTKDMNFCEWVKALEKEGSSQDPIWADGVETTPEDLCNVINCDALDPVKGVRISFWASSRTKFKRKYSTCLEMLKDRRGYHAPWKPKPVYDPEPKIVVEKKHKVKKYVQVHCPASEIEKTINYWMGNGYKFERVLVSTDIMFSYREK